MRPKRWIGTIGQYALVGALCAVAPLATAATYPERPVRMIVPTAVGGAVDTVARMVGQALAVRWGQAVLVDNKPGAAGAIGAAQVARAPADGYTLAFISTGYTTLSSMGRELGFDPEKDLIPVGIIGATPFVLLVPEKASYRSAQELVDYAKRQPGQLAFSSGGAGTLTHLLAEAFKDETGTDMLHVPYGGAGPALQALLGGQVGVYFDPISTSAELVKSGRLRALGTTGTTPSSMLPDVPTLSSLGIPVKGSVWFGIVTPKGTPDAVVERINTDLNAVLETPELRETLTRSGVEVQTMTPDAFGRFLASETQNWGGLIQRISITAN